MIFCPTSNRPQLTEGFASIACFRVMVFIPLLLKSAL